MMKLFWLLLLPFLQFGMSSYGASRNVSSRPSVVNIGAVFTFNSSIGRAAKITIAEAVKDVNSNSSILGGTRLAITMLDSNCSGFVSIVEALQFMESETLAIIGPQSSVLAHLMNHVTNELQIPLVSFAATDPTLSSIQFPFFVRTTHSDLYQMTAISEMIDYYGWKEVIAIFLDDDYGRNGVATLRDKLAEKRCRITYKRGLVPTPGTSLGEITDILVEVTSVESRVIVLHTNQDVGLKILSVASQLEMMGNGYVWIATDWLSTFLDSSPSLPLVTMESMQGIIVFRPHTFNSEKKRKFFTRWNKLTGGSPGLNSYALYAYDTVLLIAHAINAYLDKEGIISFSNYSKFQYTKEWNMNLEAMNIFDGGKLFLKNILETSLMGLTGPFLFTPDRTLIYPAYDVINVVGTGFRRIGYWSNHSGLSVLPPETLYTKPSNRSSANQKLHSAFWPGETIVKPRGWAFPNNGKQLRIGVPSRVNFPQFVNHVKGTDKVNGFCIDVFTAAVKLLPYGVPYKFIPYGDGFTEPDYDKLLKLLATNVFDAVVGDIAISTNRTKIVDFTQPFAESGLVIVAPIRRLYTGGWAFLWPFTSHMWAATAAFFLFIGFVMWALEHKTNAEFRGPPRRQVLTILLFSLETLIYPDGESVVSVLGRFVLLVWLFVVLIIKSIYDASLASILTVQKLHSPIGGIESLIKSSDPIGCRVGSYAESYLRDILHVPKSKVVPLVSPEEFALALKHGPGKGGVAAVVHERPYMELFLSNHCKFKIIGQDFTNGGWGFAFPRDTPLTEDMSTAILALSENGELQRIRDKWLTRKGCNTEAEELEANRLYFRSFWGLFLTSGVAFFVALAIYFVQIVWEFKKSCPNESDSTVRGSLWYRCLQTFFSFVKEKKQLKKRQTENSANIEKDDKLQRKLEGRDTELSLNTSTSHEN